MTDEEKQLSAQDTKSFAMTEEDDLQEFLAENDEHVHVHGCCSCHSNVGK